MKNENKELVDAAEASLEESKAKLRESQVAMVLQTVDALSMIIRTSKRRVEQFAEAIEALRLPWEGVELTAEQEASIAGMEKELAGMSEKSASMPRRAWDGGSARWAELASLGIAFDPDAVYQVVVDAGGDLDAAMPTVVSLLTLTTPGPMTAYAPAEA